LTPFQLSRYLTREFFLYANLKNDQEIGNIFFFFLRTDAVDCERSSVVQENRGSLLPSLPFAARRRGDAVRSAVACSAVANVNATRTRNNNAQEVHVPSTVLRVWLRRLYRKYVYAQLSRQSIIICFIKRIKAPLCVLLSIYS